jgi:hypothetical protein
MMAFPSKVPRHSQPGETAMTSARKTKLIVKHHPPRNPLVAPALQRKAGSHRPSRKSERQTGQQQLRQALRERDA